MTPRPRDGAERLLALATAGLPPRRAEWGAAMRAELAALDGSTPQAAAERRRFARSAAAAAFRRGVGLRLAAALATGILVAGAAVAASRLQLPSGGPGILEVTIPVPAALLLLVALVIAVATRCARFGLETGMLAVVMSFGAVFAVVAVEGAVWMDRHGVFLLDGDPPRQVVGATDAVLDLFSTGMWLGHLLFWLPWPIIGAVIGGAIGARRSSHDPAHDPTALRE